MTHRAGTGGRRPRRSSQRRWPGRVVTGSTATMRAADVGRGGEATPCEKAGSVLKGQREVLDSQASLDMPAPAPRRGGLPRPFHPRRLLPGQRRPLRGRRRADEGRPSESGDGAPGADTVPYHVGRGGRAGSGFLATNARRTLRAPARSPSRRAALVVAACFSAFLRRSLVRRPASSAIWPRAGAGRPSA